MPTRQTCHRAKLTIPSHCGDKRPAIWAKQRLRELAPQLIMSLAAEDDMPEASRVFSTFTNPPETQSTVIVGAGIIGCATAYYMSRSGNTKPDTIHLVEASPELFASASGKAAGFCAPDCRLDSSDGALSILTRSYRVRSACSIPWCTFVQAS